MKLTAFKFGIAGAVLIFVPHILFILAILKLGKDFTNLMLPISRVMLVTDFAGIALLFGGIVWFLIPYIARYQK